MTEQQIKLYMLNKKKSKRKRALSRVEYEAEHEYSIGTNEIDEYRL
jgi:hypothetical protein